jgi:hypothetical protein
LKNLRKIINPPVAFGNPLIWILAPLGNTFVSALTAFLMLYSKLIGFELGKISSFKEISANKSIFIEAPFKQISSNSREFEI